MAGCLPLYAFSHILHPTWQVFDSIANFGSKTSIEKARESVMERIDADLKVYHALNEGRNPLAGLETYVVAGLQRFFHHC